MTKRFPKNKGRGGKFLAGARLGLAVLFFLGVFFLLGGAAPARELSPQEEAALFSLADLGPVEFSPKTVAVEIFISPAKELAPCRRMLPLVWKKVQEFYAPLGVNLVEHDAGAQPGPLAPAERLRVEMLTQKEWLAGSFKAFEVQPPFRLRFLQVCRDKCAFAHLPLSVVHVSFKKFLDTELSPKTRNAQLQSDWLANLLIHELGHLLGLYHAHEFLNDPVPETLPDGKTPNFMSHRIAFESEMGAVDFQKRLIHSYLGRGKVYQQYAQVNFDPMRYLELIKKYNGYREPEAGKTGLSKKKPGKSGKTKTLEEDEEDHED